jgi:hypothetical protein
MRRWLMAGLLVNGLSAAPATAQADPVAGLVGQSVSICGGVMPFEAVIEQATLQTRDDGSQLALLIVQATNMGTRSSNTAGATTLHDERGRTFDQITGTDGIYYSDLMQETGARAPILAVQPGLSARQVWAFRLPADLQALTIGRHPLYSRC